MIAILLAFTVGVFPAQDARPARAKGAIRKADKVLSMALIDLAYWKEEAATQQTRDEIEAQYQRAVDTVNAAEALAKPLKMSVSIRTVTTQDDGSVAVEGTFQVYDEDIATYRTKEEADEVADYVAKTKRIEQDHKVWLRQRKRDRREINKRYLTDFEVTRFVTRFDAITTEGRRKYRQDMKERKRQEKLWFRDLNQQAQPRKEYVEQVAISVVILPDLVKQVDLPKLASAKRVLLTMQVEGFTIRAPPEEIERPHAIGSLSGVAINVTKNMLRKNRPPRPASGTVP